MTTAAQLRKQLQQRKVRRRKAWTVGVIGGTLALLAGGVLWAVHAGNKAADGSADGAARHVRQEVAGCLISPGTADFDGGGGPTAAEAGAHRWRVSGVVDAQNSLGALVRIRYRATVTFDAKTRLYTAETLHFDAPPGVLATAVDLSKVHLSD